MALEINKKTETPKNNQVRIWQTTDGRYVLDGDPDAAVLAYAPGEDVPSSILKELFPEVGKLAEQAEKAQEKAAEAAQVAADAAQEAAGETSEPPVGTTEAAADLEAEEQAKADAAKQASEPADKQAAKAEDKSATARRRT